MLAGAGSDGYPYAVPLNYVYDEREKKIFFHSARSGHKLDAIRENEKVSFCVIGKDQLVPEEYTTYFSSVIVFGRARVLSDDSQKRRTLRLLADKYVGDPLEKVDAEIDRFYDTVIMVEISVEHMTGKQAIELVR